MAHWCSDRWIWLTAASTIRPRRRCSYRRESRSIPTPLRITSTSPTQSTIACSDGTTPPAFTNDQPADIVIGQPDPLSVNCNDGSPSAIPTDLARTASAIRPTWRSTASSNLYVADAGDNRVLEFSTPFSRRLQPFGHECQSCLRTKRLHQQSMQPGRHPPSAPLDVLSRRRGSGRVRQPLCVRYAQ